MSIRSSLALFRVPSFTPVLLAILLASLGEAVAGSYMALLAVAKIGMSPLELSTFLTLSAVSGIAVTTVFGQRHDRNPVMWPLLLALVAKAVGYGLCAVLTETWMLLLNAFFLFGLSSASFALLFAIAKGHLDRAGAATVQRGMAALRLTSSLAWAIGPAVGAGLVALWSFEGVFAGAAVLVFIALGLVVLGRIEAVPADVGERPKITLDVVFATAPAVVAMTAFHLVMFMGSNAMSIVVIEELGTATDVGLLYSLCAALEVLVMAVFVVRPVEGDTRWLLLVGFALYTIYFIVPVVWPTLAALYWGQVLRAIAIGIISVLGMAYIQGLLPGRAGVASALFGNTVSAGFLLSGLGTGLWAEGFGYWSLFVVCAVVSLIGGAVLYWPRARSVTA